ncbi:MAG: hypothetical protein WBO09_01680 [Methylocystis silviterrae]|uniref:hypothetical protein n=1 Tax=Methylocystis silviterrae TaxID=2743612 RepID=UPI003C70B1BF
MVLEDLARFLDRVVDRDYQQRMSAGWILAVEKDPLGVVGRETPNGVIDAAAEAGEREAKAATP